MPYDQRAPAERLSAAFAHAMVELARARGAASASVEALRAAAAQASGATIDGHVCVPLAKLQRQPGISDDALRSHLLESSVVGPPAASSYPPLVLDDDGRLYLARYFDYECRLARLLAARAAQEIGAVPPGLHERLDRLFAASAERLGDRVDGQKVAVALAMLRKLAIISGGPGTGKTTTIVSLLACLLAQDPDCRIALAAPTGKAAARMLDAVREGAPQLAPELAGRFPAESFTIHRLIGASSDGTRFRHHAGNPLALDVLVVDEASMLDLALATRLFEAVPAAATIVLLGDKDQLAAVEAGSVFADLAGSPVMSNGMRAAIASATGIEASPSPSLSAVGCVPLQDCVVWLTENFRFGEGSAIGTLAAGINQGDAERTLEWLRTNRDPAVTWIEDGNRVPASATLSLAAQGYQPYLDAVASNAPLERIFDAFDRFRVLCAERHGPRGVAGLNALLTDWFRRSLGPLDPDPRSPWYPGRPIMLLANDYGLRLFNGDVGLVLPDADNVLRAVFRDSAGGYRHILLSRLPPHGSAFAMTVHKAQGNEFDQVLVVLPARASAVVGRELLYTSITRARSACAIAAGSDTFMSGISARLSRHSGLGSRLADATKHGDGR